ncbi:hypothetical protein Q9L42_007795 [Methylomarinum sp. Ch1-1]|uniref:Uncharacterized protein n=1 Tax=Methylomarinum roseum TaxID=3067653 RepID=A0AAU7NY73_9GAMM
MNNVKLFPVLILALFSAQAWAYGSSSSKKACKSPKFSQFAPSHLSVVAPESEFSFFASSITNPSSIEVSVKKQPVEVTVDTSGNGYLVSGKLPAPLQNTYARVQIEAKGGNQCRGQDGWLLKIE